MLHSNEPFDVRACLREVTNSNKPARTGSGRRTLHTTRRPDIAQGKPTTCCRCLKLRRLIEVKRAASRPRNLAAVAELEAIAAELNGRPEI